MMKLRINPLVAKDLKSIKDYIAEDNADKALETIQEIYSQFENIQQFPYIGVDLSKRVSFKTDYKYVVWKDYVVLYKVGKEVVEIYRVVNRLNNLNQKRKRLTRFTIHCSMMVHLLNLRLKVIYTLIIIVILSLRQENLMRVKLIHLNRKPNYTPLQIKRKLTKYGMNYQEM